MNNLKIIVGNNSDARLDFSQPIGYNGTASESGGLLKWSKRRDSKTCDHFGSLAINCLDFSRLPGYHAEEIFAGFSPVFLPVFFDV